MNHIKGLFNHQSKDVPNANLKDFGQYLPLIHEYFNDYSTKGFQLKKKGKYKPTILKFFPSNGKEPDHKNHGQYCIYKLMTKYKFRYLEELWEQHG